MRNCTISTLPHEETVANYWWSLPLRSMLPLNSGASYQLLFAGQRGGAAGPDVRDAVLCNAHPRPPLLNKSMRDVIHAQKYVGDVEFHVRASDWVVHRHHSDPRYNNVVLHVVLLCDDPAPTMRQNGLAVPVCSLYDLPTRKEQPLFSAIAQGRTLWPCQRMPPHVTPEVRTKSLENAGLLRFEQKTYAFVEQLHASDSVGSPGSLAMYDACLIPALAEGLGYGRNRDFFRAVGLHLCGQRGTMPEPLGRAPLPAPLDAGRLRSLYLLVERWRTSGLWQKLRIILQSLHTSTNADQTLSALRTIFGDTGLSLARADILIINAVLPFAAAIGLLEHDTFLSECALKLYKMHPGLPSNWITRMMSAQLQLPAEPRSSCLQQGLQHIYRETCREKHCEICIAGKETSI